MAYNEAEYQKEYCKKYYQTHKSTIRKRVRERYIANREKCLEQVRYHKLSKESKDNKIAYQRKMRSLYPQVFRARKMVGRAVKAGTLVRGVCEKCGSPRVEAHHDSYEVGKELNVRWFCNYHHRLIEGRILVPQPQAELKTVEV